jgi:hypothetical protein
MLDVSSFNIPADNVVLYSLKYAQGNKLVFSIQHKPSNADISTFVNQRMPIRIEFSTKLGRASLGIIGQQAVVSLPTNDNLWILAPKKMRVWQVMYCASMG